ncbi:ABC transporter substrate-binding protein [Pseudonocardia sp. K10HN5]|uniref:ABC transporter substrate-binding protein n=2 Tax=Pseudonocardia acidicola TaxID=2724939 RepID=A0ABX1SFJ4_9PSEU|nr:ABC transporter substrate-binding protein [Pseudonocardia acidicola]NMH99151.1 ABC transporter substrate-binding protein [Pseudonocardia acidicola]
MSVVPRLAESWESDATGTRWRIRLRAARWHDGTPLTAEDVLYSYRRIVAQKLIAAPLFAGLDPAHSGALGERELELVLAAPNFEFPTAWGAPATEIVRAGTTGFAAPVGTGPFRFASFTPGGPAVFARFDGHWNGAPQLDELEFVPITEESARLGALLSGQVHYAHDLSAVSARQVEGSDRTRLLVAPRSGMQAVALKRDRPPFDDPRLVRAVLAGVDREALVRVALNGRGEVGNDLFGKGLQHYAAAIPQRTRDVDAARALVREAGAQGLRFELDTSAADPAFDPATALLAEQLAEVGLTVVPRVGPAETHFADVLAGGVAGHVRSGALPLTTYLSTRVVGGRSGNYTRYRSRYADDLFAAALRSPDPAGRAARLVELQELTRDVSGTLVWGFSDRLVGVAATVSGIVSAVPNAVGWARFDTAVLR